MLTTAKLEITIGVLTIVTGLLYVFKVFGETEAIVHTWGILAVFLGVIIICIGVFSRRITNMLAIIPLFFLLLIQTPAITLWFIFHGSGISDGSPQSEFTAHWLFAVPHLFIFLLGLIAIASIFKNRTGHLSGRDSS